MSSKIGIWMGLALLGLGLTMLVMGAVAARPKGGAKDVVPKTTFLSHRAQDNGRRDSYVGSDADQLPAHQYTVLEKAADALEANDPTIPKALSVGDASWSRSSTSQPSTPRPRSTTPAASTATATTTITGVSENELLNVCCHHTMAFGVVPNVTWGTTTLEQQSTYTALGCDGVLQRRFGTLSDSPRHCREMASPVYTFYMYRVTGAKDWPIENVNAASLGGVLWYLHNEVIVERPRKFGITRIRRFK